MAIDPSIPLQGRSPNLIQSMAQGAQAASQANDIAQMSQMRNFLRESGPAVFQGDPQALGQFAQYDPQGAASINESTQRLKIVREEGRRQASRFARELKAEEAQAEAQKIKQAVAGGVMTKSPEQWDAFMRSVGADQFVGQFENREAIGAFYLGVSDVLDATASDRPEYKVVGNALYDLNAEGGPQAVGEGLGQTTVVRDANGNIIYQQGPAVSAPPDLTVEAGKNTGFYLRMKDSHEILNDLEPEGLDFLQQNADALPLGLGNYGRTPEFQKFDQARRDFVNALLRRESGAVISPEEFDNANKQYFPQPGDSKEVIEQKRRNRANAIEGIRISSGEGAAYVDRGQPQPSSDDPVPENPPPFLSEQDASLWQYMDESDRRTILEVYK